MMKNVIKKTQQGRVLSLNTNIFQNPINIPQISTKKHKPKSKIPKHKPINKETNNLTIQKLI